MIDLRKKEAEDDVFVLVYKGSEDDCKKAARIIGRKPGIHKGTTWYFRFGVEKDARAAWAKTDGKEIKGKFTYQKLAWKDWKKITDASESIDEKEIDMIDLREKKTSKKEDEKEIKFVNKGDEFKSEKADDVKIVDIEKKDDKTEVTYKLGDEEKKGDIEDILKMLNGAEYKKADDKKDEKKACEDGDEEKPEEEPVEEKKSCEEDDDAEETPAEEEPAEEKKAKKESIEDDSVEVTLTEDFHVPGTDIILEKGDVITVIPKKMIESKADDKDNLVGVITDYIQENDLTDIYDFKQLIALLKDVVKDFENAEDLLY